MILGEATLSIHEALRMRFVRKSCPSSPVGSRRTNSVVTLLGALWSSGIIQSFLDSVTTVQPIFFFSGALVSIGVMITVGFATLLHPPPPPPGHAFHPPPDGGGTTTVGFWIEIVTVALTL